MELELDEKAEEFAQLFRIVFTEAINLQNLHIGFRRLVSVPLRTVFHEIKLEKLRYLGLHQWSLESGELLELLLRHRHIKYLRLRYVLLQRGSWTTVLKTIRLNLMLSWASLRGIQYPLQTVLPQPPPHFGHQPSSDSDDDSEPDDEWVGSEDEDEDEQPQFLTPPQYHPHAGIGTGAQFDIGADDESSNDEDISESGEDSNGSHDGESDIGYVQSSWLSSEFLRTITAIFTLSRIYNLRPSSYLYDLP